MKKVISGVLFGILFAFPAFPAAWCLSGFDTKSCVADFSSYGAGAVSRTGRTIGCDGITLSVISACVAMESIVSECVDTYRIDEAECRDGPTQMQGRIVSNLTRTGDYHDRTACVCKMIRPAVSEWVFAHNFAFAGYNAGHCAEYCALLCAGGSDVVGSYTGGMEVKVSTIVSGMLSGDLK